MTEVIGHSMSGVVLALDLGTTTGWAMRTADSRALSGTWDFKNRRFEGGGMRYLRFEQALDELFRATGGFERIAFEEVRRHAGTSAAHVYGGMMATLTAWAEKRKIPYEGIPIGTWKKSLTRNGAASKDAVKARVRELGFFPSDDNEADAIGVLLHVFSERNAA